MNDENESDQFLDDSVDIGKEPYVLSTEFLPNTLEWNI